MLLVCCWEATLKLLGPIGGCQEATRMLLVGCQEATLGLLRGY